MNRSPVLFALSLVLILAGLGAPSAHAQLYLEIETTRGDLIGSGFDPFIGEPAIELNSFSQSNTIEISIGGGTGGREEVGPLKIQKRFDAASIGMQAAMSRQDAIVRLTLRAYDADPTNGTTRHYLTVSSDNARFAKRTTQAQDDPLAALENWEIVFQRLTWRNELTGEEHTDDLGGLSGILDPLERGIADLAPVPNPTSGRTTFSFRLPESGNVTIDVYDLRGRLVSKVFEGPTLTTQSTVEWDGTDETGALVAQGVYLVKMRTGRWLTTQKLSVIR